MKRLPAVIAFLALTACGSEPPPDPGAGFTDAQNAFVAAYMAERGDKPITVDRMVSEPTGLGHEEMATVIGHPTLGERGLEVMADMMHPADSTYFDAIFGAYHGQKAIREWLIPAMADIAFIAFEPRAEPAFIDDGLGGTSVDEWQMVATMEDGVRVPLSRGTSIRYYRDGWINAAMDFYDTVGFRSPPPQPTQSADAGETAPPPPALPDPPKMDPAAYEPAREPIALSEMAKVWVADRLQSLASEKQPFTYDVRSELGHGEIHAVLNDPVFGREVDLVADLMHPTESVYIDPLFGEFKGQAAIRAWLKDIMGKVGDIEFVPVGPIVFNGEMSAQVWKQVAVLPDGRRVTMTWGASIRRFKDGWIVYAADYFDVATLADEDVRRASIAAGSTITPRDIRRYTAPPGQ